MEKITLALAKIVLKLMNNDKVRVWAETAIIRFAQKQFEKQKEKLDKKQEKK